MNTTQLFHFNNNLRLLKLAETPQPNEEQIFERVTSGKEKVFDRPIESKSNSQTVTKVFDKKVLILNS